MSFIYRVSTILKNRFMLKVILKAICCILFTLPVMTTNAQTDIVKTAIQEIGRQFAPDSRTAIFSISGEISDDSLCILKGRCDNRQAVDALLQRLNQAGVKYVDNIQMLPDKELGTLNRGLVTVCCASLRSSSRHAAEMMTQAILGTPLRILERDKEWLLVQTPDNYIGWIPANSVSLQDDAGWNTWKEAPRYVYTAYQGFVYDAPNNHAGIVSDMVAGAILQANGKAHKGFVPVIFPDGRKGFLKSNECCDLAQWAARPLDMKIVVQTARQMMGSTYLWGGTSVKGADCSGFVKTAYFCGGVILSRDASQQALTGEIIPANRWRECHTGDLLFFGNARGRVDHVALYLNNGEYIHCSGRVKINSLDPTAANYRPDDFLSISRMENRIGTPGITAVKAHPWYFNQK